MAVQLKSGYLRGVRGLLVTQLNADGSTPASPEVHWIDTAQKVGIELEIEEGESATLRGGDHILARIEEDDTIVGANLKFTNARFDAPATTLIGGGSLVTQDGDPNTIIGWEAPTISEQASGKTPFKADVYVQNYNSSGGKDGFLKYEFRYCKGTLASVEHSDQDWGTPEFEVKGRENPYSGLSVYRKTFVSALPNEALAAAELSDVTTISVINPLIVLIINNTVGSEAVTVAAATTVDQLIASLASTNGSTQTYTCKASGGTPKTGDTALITTDILVVTAADGTTAVEYDITVSA